MRENERGKRGKRGRVASLRHKRKTKKKRIREEMDAMRGFFIIAALVLILNLIMGGFAVPTDVYSMCFHQIIIMIII